MSLNDEWLLQHLSPVLALDQFSLFVCLFINKKLFITLFLSLIFYLTPSSILLQTKALLSQISHLLVVILELSGVSEVQYKEIMMSSINKDN